MSGLPESLTGQELTSIEFVMDYVQFRFDGGLEPCLSLYAWPVVQKGDQQFMNGTVGYRDAMCERIGSVVSSVTFEDGQRLVLRFSDDAEISLSMKDENYSSPEIMQFKNGDTIIIA